MKEYLLMLLLVPLNSGYAVIEDMTMAMPEAQYDSPPMAKPADPRVPQTNKNCERLRVLIDGGILRL